MRSVSRKIAAWLVAAMMTLTTLSVPMTATAATSYGFMHEDSQPTGGKMLADAFMVRPFMLVSTVLTTATFIVTLPFSALGGNVGESADKLVKEPAAYTFTRPLGEM